MHGKNMYQVLVTSPDEWLFTVDADTPTDAVGRVAKYRTYLDNYPDELTMRVYDVLDADSVYHGIQTGNVTSMAYTIRETESGRECFGTFHVKFCPERAVITEVKS